MTTIIPLVGKLGKGKFAIVDINDVQRVAQHKWWLHNGGYAFTKINRINVMMHRFVFNLDKGDPKRVDHKDTNRLNNSKNNIRLCTHKENLRYKGPTSRNKSGYKGVCFQIRCTQNPWVAYIKTTKVINLGSFPTKEKAALAYNQAALKYFGKFAWLNPL